MRKFFLSLIILLTLSNTSQALNVLIQNDSDHAVQIYASHTAYIPSFLSTDKKWYYVGPYQSIKIKAHDEKTTRIYMYRVNLKAALSNVIYLGSVYTGSTALSMSNALAWIPAAATVATTTWNGLPITMQTIDPNDPVENSGVKAILIQNYTKNKDTIQSVQAIANLKDFIDIMVSNIGPMVNEHREFTERYNQLADLVTHNNNLWEIYDVAEKLELDLNETIGLKIQAAQKKSIKQTIADLQPIIDEIPTLKNEYNDLQQLKGIDFYINAVKLMQRAKNIGSINIPEPESLSSSDNQIGSVQSDDEEYPVPPELD